MILKKRRLSLRNDVSIWPLQLTLVNTKF